MPRMKSETSVLLDDLQARIAQLVEAARREGHDEALSSIRQLVSGGSAVAVSNGAPIRRGPGRPKGSKNQPKVTKSGKPRKNPWANMTAEQKADRVKKMLAGRGLKPKNG
jgi:hypothetical protein